MEKEIIGAIELIANVDPEIISTLNLKVSGTLSNNNIGAKPDRWQPEEGWLLWNVKGKDLIEIAELKHQITKEFPEIKETDFIFKGLVWSNPSKPKKHIELEDEIPNTGNFNVSIDNLRKHYSPAEIWNSCDKITNLSDDTLGYYAYVLQQEFDPAEKVVENILCSNEILVSKRLSELKLPMKELKIRYSNKHDLHQYELFFYVSRYSGLSEPIILRNGYLLKCMNEAGINSFNELKDYNAILIFNNASVNPHFSAFVKFTKH